MPELTPLPGFKIADPKKAFKAGTREYEEALYERMADDIRRQIGESFGRRGAFYSGPAAAQEATTLAQIRRDIALQSAEQERQERLLAEERAYEADEARKTREAVATEAYYGRQHQRSLAEEEAAAGLRQSAISGGLGAVGQTAGTYMGLKWLAALKGAGAVAPAISSVAAPAGGLYGLTGAGPAGLALPGVKVVGATKAAGLGATKAAGLGALKSGLAAIAPYALPAAMAAGAIYGGTQAFQGGSLNPFNKPKPRAWSLGAGGWGSVQGLRGA